MKIETEKLSRMIEDMVYDNLENVTNANRGHSIIHKNLTDTQMLDRVIKEDKNNVSSFYDDEKENDYPVEQMLSDAIYDQAENIAVWVNSERYEFDDPKDFQSKTIDLDLRTSAPIGHGFDKTLKEKETTVIRLVLQRDFSGENMYGFYLKTAYPNIERGTYTGKEYKRDDVVKNTQSSLSLWERIKLTIEREVSFCKIYEDKVSREQGLRFSVSKNSDEKIVVFITNAQTDIILYDLDERIKMTPMELAAYDSNIAKTYAKAMAIKELLNPSKQTDKNFCNLENGHYINAHHKEDYER